MTTVNVILGSSRKSSLGKNLFNYLKNNQKDYETSFNVKFNLMEIGQYQLPFFYEDIPPLNNKDRKLKPNEQQWVDDMAKADGFVFLTPEYNHSYPAVLKNGIDFLSTQLFNKPSLIMTYSDNMRGGQIGGLELPPVLNRLGSLVLPSPMAVGNVQNNFDKTGQFLPDAPSKDFYQSKLKENLGRIAFYSQLLKDNPYQK